VARTPQRSTRRTSTFTSGNPNLDGSDRSHSAGAPAARSAPSIMSPLIPEAGSRMAKRPSDIDLEYAHADPEMVGSGYRPAGAFRRSSIRSARRVETPGTEASSATDADFTPARLPKRSRS
jgi:hypothetical protein